jgi:large conductance mechanosensitive channel
MGMIREFKEFAMKGNLVDMAVAFVMGAAFGKLVTSFIDGMIMPLIGKVISGIDFKDMKYVLSPELKDASGKIISPESAVRYGEFITVFIDFLLVAFVMFLVVKAMNKIKKKQEAETAAPPEMSTQEKLLTEIRDALRK